ncbi:MAG TPA: hypothetical protein VIH58_10330 [Chthoniobacterales bacterium]
MRNKSLPVWASLQGVYASRKKGGPGSGPAAAGSQKALGVPGIITFPERQVSHGKVLASEA